MEILGVQADIYREKNELDKAMKKNKEEEILARELDSLSDIASSLQSQAIIRKTWGDLDGAMHLLSDQENICLSSSDIDLLTTNIFTTIDSQVRKLEKNLFLLPTIVTLAPFLGLLGTVWGILVTFSELQMHSGANNAILGGLSMALATTVFGLVVAIPTLIAHNYIKNNIRQYETDMEHFSHLVLAAIEIQYRKVDLSKW